MKNATDIAARLGHSDPAFTLQRYVHADRTKLAEPPSVLEALRKARAPIGREGVRGAEASGWELALDDARVTFVVSPELFRGFSGEGNVLGDLAGADDAEVEDVAESLHGEPSIDPEAIADATGVRVGGVQAALSVLGAAGRVGFDLGRGTYFHRELPFERAALEGMHPRLAGARDLVAASAVALDSGDSATVRSGGVAYLVRFTNAGATCTCPWFAKHRGARGPCKHVLAAEQVRSGRPVTT